MPDWRRGEQETPPQNCQSDKQRNKRYAEIVRRLEKELKYSRYLHTLGVAFTAASLAMAHGADVAQAEEAGLLHDCAKCIGEDEMIRLCEENGVEITVAERRSPFLLHAKAGAILARQEYGVTDREVLRAITWHTTGRPAMTLLEKIIFLADYIEPGRCEAPRLPQIRALAFRDLDGALRAVLDDTMAYLRAQGEPIDPMTERTQAYYAGQEE